MVRFRLIIYFKEIGNTQNIMDIENFFRDDYISDDPQVRAINESIGTNCVIHIVTESKPNLWIVLCRMTVAAQVKRGVRSWGHMPILVGLKVKDNYPRMARIKWDTYILPPLNFKKDGHTVLMGDIENWKELSERIYCEGLQDVTEYPHTFPHIHVEKFGTEFLIIPENKEDCGKEIEINFIGYHMVLRDPETGQYRYVYL